MQGAILGNQIVIAKDGIFNAVILQQAATLMAFLLVNVLCYAYIVVPAPETMFICHVPNLSRSVAGTPLTPYLVTYISFCILAIYGR